MFDLNHDWKSVSIEYFFGIIIVKTHYLLIRENTYSKITFQTPILSNIGITYYTQLNIK